MYVCVYIVESIKNCIRLQCICKGFSLIWIARFSPHCMLCVCSQPGSSVLGMTPGHLMSTSPHSTSLPRPIGRPASRGGGGAITDGFQRAPGAEVRSKSFEDEQIAVSILYASPDWICDTSYTPHFYRCTCANRCKLLTETIQLMKRKNHEER